MGDAETDTGKSFAGEGPKKKALTQFCHWARPKSALYEYNYGKQRINMSFCSSTHQLTG